MNEAGREGYDGHCCCDVSVHVIVAEIKNKLPLLHRDNTMSRTGNMQNQQKVCAPTIYNFVGAHRSANPQNQQNANQQKVPPSN